MNGRGHLVTGAAVLLDAAAFAAMSYSEAASPGVRAAGRAMLAHMSPWHAMGGGIPGAAGCAAALVLYFAGIVLPDLDRKGSLANKLTRVYIGVNHRGWTHSVWAVLLASSLSAVYMPSIWLAAGMLVHDLADSLSQAGWVPFYPLGKWRVVHSTVMRRGWTPGFYSSARPGSEDAASGILALLCMLAAGWMTYIGFWPKGG